MAKLLVGAFPVQATVSFDPTTTTLSVIVLRIDKPAHDCGKRHLWRTFAPADNPASNERIICDWIAQFIGQTEPWGSGSP